MAVARCQNVSEFSRSGRLWPLLPYDRRGPRPSRGIRDVQGANTVRIDYRPCVQSTGLRKPNTSNRNDGARERLTRQQYLRPQRAEEALQARTLVHAREHRDSEERPFLSHLPARGLQALPPYTSKRVTMIGRPETFIERCAADPKLAAWL